MSKKGGNFFEEHIEKIVLAITGLVCLWLLITRVVISPNYVEYDNKKFSAGDIDYYISKQAESLESKLNQRPEEGRTYKPRLDDFMARLTSTLSGVDVNLYLPQPDRSLTAFVENRVYSVPSVGEIKDVAVNHLRAVAYVPTVKIGEESAYENSTSEPNDIDLVTVEAKFDVAQLYKRFYTNFAGANVQDERWRDQGLAEPVFAAVQLQRQELLGDGRWGDWQVVPRSKIDRRKRIYEVVEDVKNLPPGGLRVRLLRFKELAVKADLLQPQAYKIASAKEEWFPPSCYKKFVRQQALEAQKKREATKVAEKEERERERASQRQARGTESRLRPSTRGGEGESIGTTDTLEGPKRSAAKRGRGERLGEKGGAEKGKEAVPESNVYEEFDKVLITEKSDFTKMNDVLIWAHDDTVVPGTTCRYRIRLGVFNPIAGTNQFREEDKHLKNKIILWSEFSDTTELVEIPAMMYFFPRDIQESTKAVTMQVSKYVLGCWYSKDFTVKKGEVIGRVAETEVTGEQKDVTIPRTINYDTGAVLVDVVPVNDWVGGKTLHARNYYDMLYSLDGTDIGHMPIKAKNWADKLQAKFNEIKKSEKEPREPLRDWASSSGRRLEAVTTSPGLRYEEGE